MWPHSIAVGVGHTAVVVGTDDALLIAELDPWRVEVDRAVVDLVLESTPEQPEQRSAPRVLPNLRHGSTRIAASSNVAMLRNALLRMLGAYADVHAEGYLRLPGMLLVREGRGTLVPLESARLVGPRQFERMGFEPQYSQSVLIDVAAGDAIVDAPLGASGAQFRVPLDVVWLFHRAPDIAVSRAVQVARVLGNAMGPAHLTDVVALVERLPVRFMASGRTSLENALTAP